VPTRARPGYLDVTLGSIMAQAQAAGAEVIVVSDGPDRATASVARRHGARLVTLAAPRSLNAARNAGVDAAAGELIVFIDDDVLAPAGWLEALLTGVAAEPDVEVFGGPIRPLLEGGGPRACGREPAPISALDLGAHDRDARFVWGANMAIRARALARVGPFDETLSDRGDEEQWLRRHGAAGGRVRYLAAAGLHHRRTEADATLVRMSRAAYLLGRSARRNDVRIGAAKPLAAELRVLVGCAWHIARRRCGFGVVMLAHAGGRIREMVEADRGADQLSTGRPAVGRSRASTQRQPAVGDFLSGTSGEVTGIRATSRATALDALADAAACATLEPVRLRRARSAMPRRRVLALGIEQTGLANLMDAARAELARTRHDLVFRATLAGKAGKFENLNRLLGDQALGGFDWLLVVDDDVALPRDFLDNFLFLIERFGLTLAQPAHRHRSHAAWRVTRRRTGSLVRETAFVEIGPVTAFHARALDVLLPFPEQRFGWGLDAHWSAVARERGWRLGVVDATPVRHGLRRIASTYDRDEAILEAREFLRGRPYIPAVEAQRTLVTHRSW
jgi:GT2 family glycosyltransferase